jgi:hypothetical protein
MVVDVDVDGSVVVVFFVVDFDSVVVGFRVVVGFVFVLGVVTGVVGLVPFTQFFSSAPFGQSRILSH